MSLVVPKQIRESIRKKIWDKADALGWSGMADLDRATWYENWSKEKDIGGALAHFMDPRKVRVYIKDSLLKPYLRNRLENNAERILVSAGVDGCATTVDCAYQKPHGRLLTDGKVICWGNSRDWKAIVISVFERARRQESGDPYAAVLVETGRTTDPGQREVISEVGTRLGIDRVVWVEDVAIS